MKILYIPVVICLAIACSVQKKSNDFAHVTYERTHDTPMFMLWDWTRDSTRYKLDKGPLVSFTNRNYRFPETKEEMIEFDYHWPYNRRSKCAIRRLYKDVVYEKFGTDSCTVSGGFYGSAFITVLYDTPVSRLDKYYFEAPKLNKSDNRARWHELNNKTAAPTSFFNDKGQLIILSDELNESFERRLEEFYKNDSGLSMYIPFQNDTIPAFFILQYEKGSGIQLLGNAPVQVRNYLLREESNYVECNSTASSLAEEYLYRLSLLCKSFCTEKVSRIVFVAPLKGRSPRPS